MFFVPQPNEVSEGPIANESKEKSEKVPSSTKTKPRKLKTANKSQASQSTTKTTEKATNSTSISKPKRGKKRKSPIKRTEGKRPTKRPHWQNDYKMTNDQNNNDEYSSSEEFQ